MRIFEVKSENQQASAMAFRTRQIFIDKRTQSITALRPPLAEHGMIAATNKRGLKILPAMTKMGRWVYRIKSGGLPAFMSVLLSG